MENVISQPHVPGDEVVIRKSVSYHPTVWGDYFILQAQSSPSTQACIYTYVSHMWWNDLVSSKNLSFARDRLVECYFWILAVYFEPYYSRARVITTKVIAHISILDDIYDVYSTLEESQRLTEAIQRWDAKVVHQLPKYLKDYYLKLMHTFKEFEDLLASNEKYRITYLKETMKDLSKAYFEESKWRDQHYIPTLEEHLRVSLISSTYPMLECASFVGMGEIATKEAFEWITSFPKIVQASAKIGRIMNDITSHEV
ncbi:hypothetical protein C4D60_Mb07t08170 [Musa balbisiana]|uniref:Terpene synthase metal-binding domain-containing protein n=1 Tax=Musa balbisiana TaxID=52838 RepID=A0A4S8JFN8_MUSBA|nr:hypothetical protein C4D60_Mb07t08170 [Musa balbisiana]